MSFPRGYIILLHLYQCLDCIFSWLLEWNKLSDHWYWFSNSGPIFLTSDSRRHKQIYKNGKSHQHALMAVPWLILTIFSSLVTICSISGLSISPKGSYSGFDIFFESIKRTSFHKSLVVFYSVYLVSLNCSSRKYCLSTSSLMSTNMKYLRLYPTRLNSGLQKTVAVEIRPVNTGLGWIANIRSREGYQARLVKNMSPYSELARKSNKSQFTLVRNTSHFFHQVDLLFWGTLV